MKRYRQICAIAVSSGYGNIFSLIQRIDQLLLDHAVFSAVQRIDPYGFVKDFFVVLSISGTGYAMIVKLT